MQITVVDHSELFSTPDAGKVVKAISQQLSEHVAPAWAKASPPTIGLVSADTEVPAGTTAVIHVVDDGATADMALGPGWHNTGPNGEAIGKVFARPVIDHGGGVLTGGRVTVSTVLSHEIVETFLDPSASLWWPGPDGVEYAIEACDPVEFSTYEITVEGTPVTVSNFLLPAWWSTRPPTSKVDYLGCLDGPFSLMADGYFAMKENGTVKQRFGDEYPSWSAKVKEHPAARLACRIGGAVDPPAQ